MPLATDTETDELPLFSRLDFKYAYREFTYDYPTYSTRTNMRRAFFRQLAKKTRQPDLVSARLGWCGRCTYPEFKTSLTRVQGGVLVCAACIGAYTRCACCGESAPTAERYYTLDFSTPVCRRCYTTVFRHCPTCDGYFHRRNRQNHRHADGGTSCCSSDELKFRVRNNGNGMLRNDKKTHIQLPAGEISQAGMETIQKLVHDMYYDAADNADRGNWLNVSSRLFELGNQWQTKDGNFSKRLSRFAYKQYGLKVPPKLMTHVGNAARDHSTAVDFTIAVTRKLNLPARDFAHPESCWWSSYGNSRCALKTNGGFGVRSFDGSDVTGRAWVMPLKKRVTARGNVKFDPTYDTLNADAFIVFNGYGNLSGYTGARIISYMNGMTYRKVGFACDPMYVNSDSGFLVGPEELIEGFTDSSFSMSVSKHANLFQREQELKNKELVNA